MDRRRTGESLRTAKCAGWERQEPTPRVDLASTAPIIGAESRPRHPWFGSRIGFIRGEERIQHPYSLSRYQYYKFVSIEFAWMLLLCCPRPACLEVVF